MMRRCASKLSSLAGLRTAALGSGSSSTALHTTTTTTNVSNISIARRTNGNSHFHTSASASSVVMGSAAAAAAATATSIRSYATAGGSNSKKKKDANGIDDADDDDAATGDDSNGDSGVFESAAERGEAEELRQERGETDGEYDADGHYDSSSVGGRVGGGGEVSSNNNTNGEDDDGEEEDGISAVTSAGIGGRTAIPSLRTAYPPSGVELPEESFLKCIEKEMEDEKLRLDKEESPPRPLAGWEMHHVPGSSVLYGRRMWMPPATSIPNAQQSNNNVGGTSFSGRAREGTEETKTNDDSNAKTKNDTDANGFPSRHERCIEKHFIRVQFTTRDASLDPECDIRGEHFPFSFFVQRVPLKDNNNHSGDESGDGNDDVDAYSALARIHAPTFDKSEELSMFENSIEARLDVVDGELVVDAIVYHGEREVFSEVNRRRTFKPSLSSNNSGNDGDGEDGNPLCSNKTHRTNAATVAMYNDLFGGYPGPNLDEAEEEVLDGIQSWLAERQVDDRFGEFVGQCSVWTEQAEYEKWLQQLYDYVAA